MRTAAPARVLLTVSGIIDAGVSEKVANDARPRPDYTELAAELDADVVDITEARRRAGRWARPIERLGGKWLLLAWVCFRERKRYDAVVTDGENVGLPLALMCRLSGRRSFVHVMITHVMSVRRKVLLYRLFRLRRYIETMVVYSSAQRRFATAALQFPADRVVLTPFMVDTRFFSVERTGARPERMICAAGLEFRDYPTLIEAVKDLDVRVVIGAASPWSKRDDNTTGIELPANVEVGRLDFVELRQLYADALFVVMPLLENDFQAGVTTILEAMAMGRAVVCSRTTGQTDVVVDGVTGLYVPPGSAPALRAAIVGLIDDDAAAKTMGEAARALAERDYDVSVYARRIGHIVARAIDRQRRHRTFIPNSEPHQTRL